MPLGRRGGFEGLEVCGEFAWGFQIQATREVMRATYARRFGVEENFSQAFFCHCLGRGKFQAKLFFAMVSENAAGVGDVGGARCPPRLCGDFDRRQEATERQRAMRVRGSAQGREISLTRFVFFRLLSSSLE